MTQQPLDLAPVPAAPSGHRDRFDRRWHLVGAGLSNVWLFGDLQLPARSGRLLLRGPNGTGKTTALEGLCPYLLDLNQQRLGAGKSRVTTLKTLMETGAAGKRRYGYMWLEFGAPGEQEVLSFGVRLQYSQGSSPAITVVPFFVRGRPLEDLILHGPNRAPLTSEEFAGAVAERGGEIFEDPEDYITRLGTHVLRFTPDEIRLLAQRMRQVRNPSLLGDVTSREAADSLRQSLPGVDPDVVDATGKALSESESTRKAFARDSRASDVLTDFAAMWGGHVVDVVSRRHADAVRHGKEAARARTKLVAAEAAHGKAKELSASADTVADRLTDQLTDARARVTAAEQHDAYKAAGRIEDLQKASDAQADAAALETGRLGDRASAIARAGVRLMDAATALSADIDASITAAITVDADARPVPPPLTWHTVPQAVITVAEIAADPGPVVRVDGDVGRIVAVVQHWRSLGARHRSRAEQAALALTDHGVVEEADRAATKAESNHDALVGAAESTAAAAMTAAVAAGSAARALRVAVGRWVRSNANLTPGWSEDTAPTSDDEPAVVLSDAEDLASSTGRRAAENAGRSRAHAVEATAQAHQLREQASDLRVQALGLRDGKLLPLPRPDWAGPGDDNVAFGTALEWRDDVVDGTLRALVESAMAAAGLLGATLADSAASTSNWTVDAGDTGIPRRSLAEVLAADPNHPSAAIAMGVLDRVEFANTAGDTDSSEATLVIGADGTFRAGVLWGRAPGTGDPSEAPAAAHIGARQRRAAALAEANRLDSAADRLVDEAGIRDADARRLDAEADDFERRAATFPDRNPLARAEADRARLAANAVEAMGRADAADQRARALRSEHQREAREWAERTRLAGLPVAPDELTASSAMARGLQSPFTPKPIIWRSAARAGSVALSPMRWPMTGPQPSFPRWPRAHEWHTLTLLPRKRSSIISSARPARTPSKRDASMPTPSRPRSS